MHSYTTAQTSAVDFKMGRFLIYFQYIGTRYRGVARAGGFSADGRAFVGVQDVLEQALADLKPVDAVKLHVSSRTDTGVHALCNTAHFDIAFKSKRSGELRDIPAESITAALNKKLCDQDVRIIKTLRVPDNFHSQHLALGRSYLYRLATGCRQIELPVFEKDRCWATDQSFPDKSRSQYCCLLRVSDLKIREDLVEMLESLPYHACMSCHYWGHLCFGISLNIELMEEASRRFLGTHDFSAFRSASSDDNKKSPIKTMDEISLRRTKGFLNHQCHQTAQLEFWEVTFRSRSFLYRQIRRMTGALVAVGLGRISPSDITAILESCDNSHMHGTTMAPPYGLYLKEVLYNENDLQLRPAPSSGDDTSIT